MKVINKKLLAEFRQPGLCELCGKPCPEGRDPAHLLSRGAGRVDIRKNLISAERSCHALMHNDPSALAKAFEIVAAREGCTVQEIIDMVHRIRADDKCKVWEVT